MIALSKAVKLINDNYLSSASIVHNKSLLSKIITKLINRYSEGIFVPKLEGENGTGEAEYNLQEGYYKRIGNVVFYQFKIGCSTLTGATGILYIKGFPCPMEFEPNLGILVVSGDFFDTSKSYQTRTYGDGLLIETNSDLNPVNNVQFNSQHYIYGSGFYFTNE